MNMQSCVVAIDSDVGFLERFERRFDEAGLLNDWTLLNLELRASSPQQAVAHAMEDLEGISNERQIDLILLDIVIMEEEEPVEPNWSSDS